MTPVALPHPPAGSMHILPPGLVSLVMLATTVVALLLLRMLWRRFRRSRPSPPAPDPPVARRAPRRGAFGALIARIEDEFTRSENFREGLHALAGAVRTRLEEVSGISARPETAEEIAASIEDDAVDRFLISLRDHRFGRREPTKSQFRKLCRTSREVLGR